MPDGIVDMGLVYALVLADGRRNRRGPSKVHAKIATKAMARKRANRTGKRLGHGTS